MSNLIKVLPINLLFISFHCKRVSRKLEGHFREETTNQHISYANKNHAEQLRIKSKKVAGTQKKREPRLSCYRQGFLVSENSL